MWPASQASPLHSFANAPIVNAWRRQVLPSFPPDHIFWVSILKPLGRKNFLKVARRKMQSRSGFRLLGVGVLLLVTLAAWSLRRSHAQLRPPAGFDELLTAMVKGDKRAVDRVRSAAAEHPEILPTLIQAALTQESPYARADGCELLFDRGAEWLPLLIPRVSDANWMVRMKAIGAVSRVHAPPQILPQRYMPIDQRDEWLLAWIDDYSAKTGHDLTGQLCEFYWDLRFVEFGRPLANRCLTCHAGREPADYATNDVCASCHAGIYAQWSGSAHAQSLSHLHLVTPNPDSSGVNWIDFLPVRGISCGECHRIQGRRATTGPTERDRNVSPQTGQCAYVFDKSSPAGESCARCHASIRDEWRLWLKGRQPRRAEWPPGQVDVENSGDSRTCVDCHMSRLGDRPDDHGQAPRDHRWGARRDLPFLRQAVDLQLVPSNDGSELQAIVTNLAGHNFPTGTHRRSVRLYAGAAGITAPESGRTGNWPTSGPSSDLPDLPEITRLGTKAPGPLPATGAPPLSPGEQRTFAIPWPRDADEIGYRLQFIRNQYDPQAYTIDVFSGKQRALIGMPLSE